jgi:two-component system response regulator PilR (NtrC family)
VRILSATHKDLATLVARGEFRQDLFYRINVIELHVPPLRERPEDIPPLVDYILTKLANEASVNLPRLVPEALEALAAYRFPGNVRELENILERAMTLCESRLIKQSDLQLPQAAGADAESESGGALGPYLEKVEKDKIIAALEQTRWNKTAAAKVLGISFGALRYRLQKLGLE